VIPPVASLRRLIPRSFPVCVASGLLNLCYGGNCALSSISLIVRARAYVDSVDSPGPWRGVGTGWDACYRAPDERSIYVDAETRIQILDTMLLLPQADKEQCAAFIVRPLPSAARTAF
jgi:hypothetical protein